jgi:hypothetical protein
MDIVYRPSDKVFQEAREKASDDRRIEMLAHQGRSIGDLDRPEADIDQIKADLRQSLLAENDRSKRHRDRVKPSGRCDARVTIRGRRAIPQGSGRCCLADGVDLAQYPPAKMGGPSRVFGGFLSSGRETPCFTGKGKLNSWETEIFVAFRNVRDS